MVLSSASHLLSQLSLEIPSLVLSTNAEIRIELKGKRKNEPIGVQV